MKTSSNILYVKQPCDVFSIQLLVGSDLRVICSCDLHFAFRCVRRSSNFKLVRSHLSLAHFVENEHLRTKLKYTIKTTVLKVCDSIYYVE